MDASAAGEPALRLDELDLRGGQFAGADLRDASLLHATLAEADLRGASLQGARLRNADLSLCLLAGADLRNADLSGADLSGADLSEANLDGADLRDAELGWANLRGARGLPTDVVLRRGADGVIEGTRTRDGHEPLPGLKAYERGQAAHARGDLGLAERHLRTALRWVPDSGAARWALAGVALEQGNVGRALTWLQQAVDGEPGADRARVDLALLLLWRGEPEEAREHLTVLHERLGAADWLAAAKAAIGDLNACAEAMAQKVGDSPAVQWLRNQPTRARDTPRPRQPTTLERLSDETWVAAERADLEALCRDRRQTAWVWHSAIGRALQIGALDLAFKAEQRLQAVAPEHRLWGIELKHLDVTAEAFAALVRTRRAGLGELKSVRWVALGAHGPTARLACEGGVFWAKRYLANLRPPASLAFTHRTAQAVADLGLAVPLPLPDRDGAPTLGFAGDTLVLYSDCPGVPQRETDATISDGERIGAWLATLHARSERLALGSGRPRAGLRVGTRILRSEQPAQAWLASMAQDEAAAAAFARHPLAQRWLSLLDATARRLRGVLPGCRVGLVHGDLGPGNVIDGESGLAVVDWDLCDRDVQVWDLARCLDLWAVDWPAESGRPVIARSGLYHAILGGYERVRPLLRDERAALPILVAASRVDLDAGVLPVCVRLEGEVLEPVLARGVVRLARAVAGAVELAYDAARWTAAS